MHGSGFQLGLCVQKSGEHHMFLTAVIKDGVLCYHLLKHDLIVAIHGLMDNNKAMELGNESTVNQKY